MMMMDETMTGSSAPIVMEMNSSGIARARPESRVTIPPPMQMTIRNGAMRSGIKDTIETFVARTPASKPVTAAMVVVGIPMDPKDGATALEIKQAMMVLIGGYPRATSIAAGIATAVPKPAMPSMNVPKPQAMSRNTTRLSSLTVVSICLMTSRLPVATVNL